MALSAPKRPKYIELALALKKRTLAQTNPIGTTHTYHFPLQHPQEYRRLDLPLVHRKPFTINLEPYPYDRISDFRIKLFAGAA